MENNMFKSADGKVSMMRVLVFIVVLSGLALGAVEAIFTDNSLNWLGMTGLITSAMVGKWAQAKEELKPDPADKL